MERGLTPSRERAQALILAGRVLVDEQKVEKAGAAIASDAVVRILGDDMPYVSRGGLKLATGTGALGNRCAGKTGLDVGASTGGFTDCLLQHGAARVIAVDTGYGQMDAVLRTDPRVRLLEKTNARYLTTEQLWPRGDPEPIQSDRHGRLVHLGDAGAARGRLRACALPAAAFELVLLVKPQFEVGRELVGKGGIVRDPEAQQAGGEESAERGCATRRSGGRAYRLADPRCRGQSRVSVACAFCLNRGRSRSVALHWMRFPLDMKSAAIISKPSKPELAIILPELLGWFRKHGYKLYLDQETGQYTAAKR